MKGDREGCKWARTAVEAVKLCEDGEYAVGAVNGYYVFTAREVMAFLMVGLHVVVVCPHGDVFEFTAKKKVDV